MTHFAIIAITIIITASWALVTGLLLLRRSEQVQITQAFGCHDRLDWIDLIFALLWPFALVLLVAYIIIERLTHRTRKPPQEDTDVHPTP